jgi:methionyl-tRNA formyltransferase
MRIVFAGTPSFAVAPLRAIAAAGHEIVAVLTRPDKPVGRGMAMGLSPVKEAAIGMGIPVEQPVTLRDPLRQDALRALAPDLLVVVAYGLILPQAVLDIPKRGAVNIHASLLPRWRGAAPIHRAIEAGDPSTGISIMQLDAGLDTGPVLLTRTLPIAVGETTGTLHDKLCALGAQAILEALEGLANNRLIAVPQPVDGVTYAAKITKSEAMLNWSGSALELERCVRAFDPAPGAFSRIGPVELKIWRASVSPGADFPNAAPGTVINADANGIDVACGEGQLRLLMVQRSGGKRMAVAELLRGLPIRPGDRFASRPQASS